MTKNWSAVGKRWRTGILGDRAAPGDGVKEDSVLQHHQCALCKCLENEFCNSMVLPVT